MEGSVARRIGNLFLIQSVWQFFAQGHYREWRRLHRATRRQEQANETARRLRELKERRGPGDTGLSA